MLYARNAVILILPGVMQSPATSEDLRRGLENPPLLVPGPARYAEKQAPKSILKLGRSEILIICPKRAMGHDRLA